MNRRITLLATLALIGALLLAALWAAHHVDLLGLMKQLHGH